jgi:GDP-L-fucose synthase
MKILITGASGYIGKNLKEKLEKKHKLFTPCHKELNLTDENEVKKYLKEKRVDVVIHSAVVGGSRKEEYENRMFFENMRMFFNLVRNKRYYKKMINLGSGAEYDKRSPIIKVNEEDFDRRVPADDYGYYKYLCSKYIEQTKGIINLRIFGIFGKYEDYRYRFISNAICRNIFNMPIVINQNVEFDYLYIDDFVNIIEYFVGNNVKHRFYNIGTGKKIDLIKLAEIINKVSKKQSKVIVKNKVLNNEYTCNNSRLKKEMKNICFTNINEAISNLYKWYLENKENIAKEVI